MLVFEGCVFWHVKWKNSHMKWTIHIIIIIIIIIIMIMIIIIIIINISIAQINTWI